MFKKIWKLLAPYHRDFYILILLAFIYETGGILISYTVPLLVRLLSLDIQLVTWFLVVIAQLSWNEGYMRLDNQFDWRVIAKLWHPIYRSLKLDAVAKFLRMPLIWHQRHNSGTMIGQVSDGVGKTLGIVSMIAWEFMPTLVQTFLSLIPMLYFSPLVAVLSVLSFALFAWITIIGEQAKRELRKKRQDVTEKEWNHSISSVQAIETVLTFGLQDYMMQILGQIHDLIIELARKEHRKGVFIYNRRRIRLLTTMRLVIYGLWVVQWYHGTIDVPSLIFLSVLMERLFSSFWRFARLADQVYGSSEAVLRLIDLMEEPEFIDSGSESVTITGPVAIDFENVCLAYDNKYSSNSGALHDLSLRFEAGKVSAMVGPSGAGKSTVIAALMKLFEIQHGSVRVAGLDIKDWSSRKLLELIAHVPPGDKVYLWDETFAYNIRIARPQATDEEVMVAAKHAGIHDFISSQERGYETVIGEWGVRLSSGQKQRVGIARAFLRNSQIIILDEPTSAVDAQTEHLIMNSLKEMFANKTVIVIAHRLSTIRDADTIFVLEKGHMVEEGNHSQLVALGGLYANLVRLQAESERLI